MTFERRSKAVDILETVEVQKIKEMEPAFVESLRRLGKKWGIVAHCCERCGAPYFGSSSQNRCGEFSCMESLAFLQRGEKDPGISSKEMATSFQLHFERVGYSTIKPRDMVNFSGTTLFIVGANQAFDPVVFQEERSKERKIAVAQPSIRTQFREIVAKEEGYSTSFINVATGIVSPTLEEHIQSIDDWISFLNQRGIAADELQLRLRTDEPDWNGKKFKNIVVDVNYFGVQLGDAVLNLAIPQETREPITLSDVGFGIERLVWALRKSPRYFSSLFAEDVSDEQIKGLDSVRTLALIAGSGVHPSQKERGYRFRLFAKTAMPLGRRKIHACLESSYAYWSDFIDLPLALEEMMKLVDQEIDRNVHLEICQKFGLKKYREFVHEPSDTFLSRLQKHGVVDLIKVRELVHLYE